MGLGAGSSLVVALAGLILSLPNSVPCEKVANGDMCSTRKPATESLGSYGLLCVTL